jgi:hypothetical protein
VSTDPASRPRAPVSTRHALALAFDLAFRRDPVHSLVVPLLLRGPWILAIALLPEPGPHERTAGRLALGAVALVGDLITALVVGAMLRVRARSVFNTAPGVRPAPASACYAAGLRRVPWLFATEAMRNFTLALAFVPSAFAGLDPAAEAPLKPALLAAISLALAVPAIFVLFRLGVATEAVVLDASDLAGAFQSSFLRMRGRIERWFELIMAGGVLVLVPALLMTAVWLMVPALSWTTSVAVMWLLVAGMWPVLQYAWTFFYLRLVEIEPIVGSARAPLGAAPTVSPSNG